jgi:hypothetical protein
MGYQLSAVLAGQVLAADLCFLGGAAMPEAFRGMNQTLCRRGMSIKQASIVSFLAAMLFVGLACVRLNGQGLYYDELHQAVGSFVYCGRPPEIFCSLTFHGIPVLNMNYSGAIKTALYGLYMRSTGFPFSVVSFRLLGILWVAIGIFAFGVIARRGFSLVALLVFLLFLLTDATVLLTTRHDWGPVALALLLRLLFLAAWVRWEVENSLATAFFLGAVIGLALFEKLSSVVLCCPLAVAILAMSFRGRFRHCYSCVGGFLVGALPLMLVNLYSFHKRGVLVSLIDVAPAHPISLPGFAMFFADYLSLADGVQAGSFILGDNISPRGDGYLQALLALLVGCWCIKRLVNGEGRSLAALMLLSYVGVGVALYLLPNGTFIHHWVLGTPFQYTAAALVITEHFSVPVKRGQVGLGVRFVFLGLIGLVFINRLPTTYTVEKALVRGEAAIRWDHSLTRFGEILAPRLHNAALIAADWGIATQPYCFAGGQGHRIYEPFGGYQGIPHLEWICRDSGCSTFYLAVPRARTTVNPAATERILADAAQWRGWEEVTPEKDLLELLAVEVKKFVKH